MTKGNYNVSAADAAQNDVSFRNCVCAMLIFVAMCSLIIVVVSITKANSPEKSALNTGDPGGEQEKIFRNGTTTVSTTTTSTTTPKIETISTLKTSTTKRPDLTTTTTTNLNVETQSTLKIGTTVKANHTKGLVPPIGDTTTTTISSTTATQKAPTKANDTQGFVPPIGDTTTTTISTTTATEKAPTKANDTQGFVPPIGDTTTTTISTSTAIEEAPTKANDTQGFVPPIGDTTTTTISTSTAIEEAPTKANDTQGFVSPIGDTTTTTISTTTATEKAPTKANDTQGFVPPIGDTTTTTISTSTAIEEAPTKANDTQEAPPIPKTSTTENASDTTKSVSPDSNPIEGSLTSTISTTTVKEEALPTLKLSTTENASNTTELVSSDSDLIGGSLASTVSTATVTEESLPTLKLSTTENASDTTKLVSDDSNLTGDSPSTTISTTTVTEESPPTLESSTTENANDATESVLPDSNPIGGSLASTVSTTIVTEETLPTLKLSTTENASNTPKLVSPDSNLIEDSSTTTDSTTTVTEEAPSTLIPSTTKDANVYGIPVDNASVTVTTDDYRRGKSTEKTVEVQSSSSTTEESPNTNHIVDSEYSPLDESDKVADDDATTTNVEKHIHSSLTTQETTTTIQADHFTEKNNSINIPHDTQSMVIEERSAVNICDTVACKTTASRMLSLMDHSGEECNDFYKYSCGGLKTDREHDHLVDVWSQFDKIVNDGKTSSLEFVDHFKKFYNSCVTHEDTFDYGSRVQAVKDIVQGLGGIILDKQTQVKTDNLTLLLAKLVLLKSLPVMDVNTEVDNKSGQYVFQITLPEKNVKGGPLGDWSTSLADERRCRSEKNRHLQDPLDLSILYDSLLDCRHDHTSHKAAVENVLRQVHFYSSLTDQSVLDEINNNLKDLDEILHLLDHVSGAYIRKVTMHENYTEVNIAKLQTDWDVINWQMFFKELHGNTLPQDTIVHVYLYEEIDIVMKHFKNMTEERSRDLHNILLILYATDVYENTVMPKQKDNREQYCLELSTHLYHDISTHMYMNHTENTGTQYEEDQIRKFFVILKENFINATEYSALFQNSKAVVEKADKLQVNFPSNLKECLNEANLNQKYENSFISTNEVFAKLLIQSIEFHHRSLFSLVGKTFDEEDMFCYFVHPYDVEPKTFYATKVIAVPYGIIRNVPRDVPDYALMARVGIHLARGIGMHFNPIGLANHTNLGMEDEDVYEDFKEIPFSRTRVVNQQNVVFNKSDLTMITEMTDNMALRMASDTFKQLQNNEDLIWIRDSFSQEKIFFISVAQEFCQKVDTFEYMLNIFERGVLPAPMRVEMMLVHSQEFTSAFECHNGTTMNTQEVRRKQFPHQ